MNQNASQYMAEEPTGELILRFSISCIMLLLVSALYNTVDQILIGRGVGFLGNGATNMIFPITTIALAILLLIGDGCATCLSICQRRMDAENVCRSVGNVIGLITVSGIPLTPVLALFHDSTPMGLGAAVNNIEYTRGYFSCPIPGIPLSMFADLMNPTIRADGSPQSAMDSILVGCIINVVLDPMATFILGWGMKEAALATIAGQIVSTLLVVYYLIGTESFQLKPTSFLPSVGILKRILPFGISSFLTQVSIAVIMAVMNNALVLYRTQSKYGPGIPLTVVGVAMKMFQIVISIVVGTVAEAQPIMGYNYGVGLWYWVKYIFCTMMIAESCVGPVSLVRFKALPMQAISPFGSEDGLYNESAVLIFHIFLSGIVPCCLQKARSIFLQSIDRPVLSIILLLLQDFIPSMSLTLLLPKLLGVTGALRSGSTADVAAFGAAALIMGAALKRLTRLTDESETERYRGINTAQVVLSGVQKIS